MIIQINFWRIYLLLINYIILTVHPISSISSLPFTYTGKIKQSEFSTNGASRLNTTKHSTESAEIEEIIESVFNEDAEIKENQHLIGTLLDWATEELNDSEKENDSLHENIFGIFRNDYQQKRPYLTNDKLQRGTKGKNKLEILVPPEKSCDSLCEDAPYYPIKTMREALMKKKYLKRPIISYSTLSAEEEITFHNRNEFGMMTSLCNSETVKIHPKIGRTKSGELRYILNIHEQREPVHLEKCTDENEICRGVTIGSDTWPFYKLICEQKYIYTKLDALDPYTKEIVPELFRMHSGCCCKIK